MDLLTRLYKSYNQEYFDNSLPLIEIKYAYSMKNNIGVTLFKVEGGKRIPIAIKINHSFCNNSVILREVLLHEMIHVRYPNDKNHGKKFKSEINRIKKEFDIEIREVIK